jgi:peptide-methionine (S)-S-oxide reductase
MDSMVEKATFGAGCFWCSQMSFSEVKGVLSTRVGYMGGTEEDPDYEEVCGGKTGHIEVVEISFDPSVLGFAKLIDIFWESHNPVLNEYWPGESDDQYRSAIFYHTEEQRMDAEASKRRVQASGRFRGPISTLILPASHFWVAAQHHQNYLSKIARKNCSKDRGSRP